MFFVSLTLNLLWNRKQRNTLLVCIQKQKQFLMDACVFFSRTCSVALGMAMSVGCSVGCLPTTLVQMEISQQLLDRLPLFWLIFSSSEKGVGSNDYS